MDERKAFHEKNGRITQSRRDQTGDKKEDAREGYTETANGYRNRQRRCSIKKGVHKKFAIFTGKHMCWSLFLIMRPQRRCFSVNIAKFLRAAILRSICERLLLDIIVNRENTVGLRLKSPSWLSQNLRILP